LKLYKMQAQPMPNNEEWTSLLIILYPELR